MRPRIPFFSALYYLFLLSSASQGLLGVSPCGIHFIQETCNKSAQIDPVLSYDMCVESLKAVPESYTTDLHGLGIVSLKLAMVNATQTSYRIDELQTQTRDLFTKQCLETCLEVYSDAILTLNDSMEAFRHKSYDDANVLISAAMDDSDTCESGFKEEGGLVSPLTKENYSLFQLCAITLAITHLA